MPTNVSVIICTRDRADSLKATLQSLAGVRVPAEFVTEVLIVDNGSLDHTHQVVADSIGRLGAMTVHYVSEPDGGQSLARNTGIRHSRGEVIVFTDDDLRFPADWLDGMVRPILSKQADAVCGGIRLAPELSRPWMSNLHRNWLASTDGMDPDRPGLIGANMAFGRHVLARTGEFDPALGPGALGFADDTQFGEAVRKAGFIIVSRFDNEVEHHFDPARLTAASFIATAKKHGRTLAYVMRNQPSGRLSYVPARRVKFLVRTLWPRVVGLIQRWRRPDRVPSEAELVLIKEAEFWRSYARD